MESAQEIPCSEQNTDRIKNLETAIRTFCPALGIRTFNHVKDDPEALAHLFMSIARQKAPSAHFFSEVLIPIFQCLKQLHAESKVSKETYRKALQVFSGAEHLSFKNRSAPLKQDPSQDTLCLNPSRLNGSIASVANATAQQFPHLHHLVIETKRLGTEHVTPSFLSRLKDQYNTITYGDSTGTGAHIVMHITPQGVDHLICHHVTAQFLLSFLEQHQGITTLEEHNTIGHNRNRITRVVQSLPLLKSFTITLHPNIQWEAPIPYDLFLSNKALSALTISGQGSLCSLPQACNSHPQMAAKASMFMARSQPPAVKSSLTHLDLSNYHLSGEGYTAPNLFYWVKSFPELNYLALSGDTLNTKDMDAHTAAVLCKKHPTLQSVVLPPLERLSVPEKICLKTLKPTITITSPNQSGRT